MIHGPSMLHTNQRLHAHIRLPSCPILPHPHDGLLGASACEHLQVTTWAMCSHVRVSKHVHVAGGAGTQPERLPLRLAATG